MKRTIATLIAAAALGFGLAACSNSEAPGSAPDNATPRPAQQAGGQHVTKQRAGAIATSRYGGHVRSVERDTAKGKPSWEVEIRDSKQGRIEVDVSRADGSVLAMERD